jgi:hypothetical protein
MQRGDSAGLIEIRHEFGRSVDRVAFIQRTKPRTNQFEDGGPTILFASGRMLPQTLC